MGTPTPPLVEITVGDEPAAWASIGFAVDDALAPVGRVSLRFAGPAAGRGLTGWALADGGGDIDGLPTTAGDLGPLPVDHPNGVVAIDHVVVLTPDVERTTAALEARGIAARRTREAGPGRVQRFFRLGEIILELVGPAEADGDGPARLWGLAFTVADLDATKTRLGDRIGAAKAAVQPGRRIATLQSSDDVSVPVAFMSGVESPAGGTAHARR